MNTELADQLRQGMDRVPARVPADLVRTAYRHYRRYHGRRIAIAAIAVAGAVAIGAVAAVSRPGPTTPGMRMTAYVENRATQALSAMSPGGIVFLRLTVTPYNADMPPTEIWAAGWAQEMPPLVRELPSGNVTTAFP